MRKKLILFIALCLLGGFYYSFRKYQASQSSLIASSPVPVSDNILPSPPASASPSPTSSVALPAKIKILDSSSWIDYACGPISYKIPADLTVRCTANPDGTFDVLVTKEGEYGTRSNIFVRYYDGGSRRQYWIKNMRATQSDLDQYVRFQESLFGTVSGLDVFASGGWWQGGYASPILISEGKTIVMIYGGRDFKDQEEGRIERWDFTDTIASTIRFTD